jgi:hypothetical protein
MARRSSARRASKSKSRAIVVRAPSQKAPVVNVRMAAPKKVKHRRGHAAGGNLQKQMQYAAAGGWGVGMIEKSFPNLPTLPVVGKKGAIALAVYFFGKGRGELVKSIGIVAAGIAGYEYATTGKVTGTVMGDVARQVGVARQT